MNRRMVLLLAATVGLSAVVGCKEGKTAITEKPGAPTQAPVKKKGTIGLSVLTLTNPFFKVIADTMAQEAAKHGYSVMVVSGEFDVARQQNQVKDFIVKRVAAMVLNPCDSKAIGPAIKEANAAGIPVFTADIACLDPDAKVVCHIATDNYQGGRMAAQAMIEALGGKGKVAVIDHPEVESVILRTKGFDDEVAEANKRPGVAIQVLGKWPGGAVPDRSFNTAQDILRFTPKRASGLIGKVLKSAIANANEKEADVRRLVVAEARIDAGPYFRRWRPKDRGRAHQILKKTSHIIVVVEQR